MADQAKRSAEILAEQVTKKIEGDADFRERISANPNAAAAEVNSLAGAAIAKSDAIGASDIEKARADTTRSAASADKWVYVIAVAALGLVSTGVVAAIFLLAYPQIDSIMGTAERIAGDDLSKLVGLRFSFSIPDGLIALGSAAIGALAGLLSPLTQRRG